MVRGGGRAPRVLAILISVLAIVDLGAAGGGCQDSAALAAYVAERVAGLDELTVGEVVAALQRQDGGCVTSDALAERERCGAAGLKDAVRAVQLFGLGLDDVVPAPIQPRATPCVQLPSTPEAVVLEWVHQADSLQRVRSFGVRRERISGDGDSAPVELQLTAAEFQKCRGKGHCTFHDLVEPGSYYIYYISATNAVGTSATSEIFCATRATTGINAAGQQCATADADADASERGLDGTPMSVSGTVAWCALTGFLVGALTVFLIDRAVVNGDLNDMITRRMDSRDRSSPRSKSRSGGTGELGRWEPLRREVDRWKYMLCLACVYALAMWMWLPVELRLLPTLLRMGAASEDYIGRMDGSLKADADGDGLISLSEIQAGGQASPLVGESLESFRASASVWESGLMRMQHEHRAAIDSMLDGTTDVWQPESMLLFVFAVTGFAYVMELCTQTKWYWETNKLLKNWLLHKNHLAPGCKVGRHYLSPLVTIFIWRGYAVVDAAIVVAINMKRNVKLLPKLANDYLPPSVDRPAIKSEIMSIVKAHLDGPRERRWGVRIGRCAGGPCHIDMTFWKVATSQLSYIVALLAFILMVLPLLARQQQDKQKLVQQDGQKSALEAAHEITKQAAAEKERQLQRATDEALSQRERIEALDRAAQFEQQEREAMKNEQDLVLQKIRLADLTPLYEDSRDPPPGKRKYDWRKCPVAQGQFGEVCRAWCEGNVRNKVAIKRLLETGPMLQRSFSRVSLSRASSGRLDLTDEQKFFLFLRHDNIVQCYGILSEGTAGINSIVTELCRCDLRSWLADDLFWREKTQSEIDDQKVHVLQQVSKGMQFLHKNLTVHLDLKGGNILLERPDKDAGRAGTTWKLCDFGEARRLQAADTTFNPHSGHDTRNVTAEIAAPELFDGPGVGMPTDIFAFGCVMWNVLTRLEPWHWIKTGRDRAIEHRVGLGMKRLGCPESGWSDMIRICMHDNAALRPDAETLSKWAHKQGGRSRRTGRIRSRTSTDDVVRVVEVPRRALLDEGARAWAGVVPGVLSCEATPLAPVHGCTFAAVWDDPDLRISTTELGSVGVTEEAVHALFEDVDEDNNGRLSRAEIRRLLERGGIEMDDKLDQELSVEWGEMAGADHEVDFVAFYRWWKSVPKHGDGGRLRHEMHRAGMFLEASVRFSCTVAPGWLVTDGRKGTGLSWNVEGKYVGKINSSNPEEWEEEALQGDTDVLSVATSNLFEEPVADPIRAVFPPSGLAIGILFGEMWPYVKRIQEGKPGLPRTLAQDMPLSVGCKLLSIESLLVREGGVTEDVPYITTAVVEGDAVLVSFKEAVPLIKAERTEERPLVLTFAPPADM